MPSVRQEVLSPHPDQLSASNHFHRHDNDEDDDNDDDEDDNDDDDEEENCERILMMPLSLSDPSTLRSRASCHTKVAQSQKIYNTTQKNIKKTYYHTILPQINITHVTRIVGGEMNHRKVDQTISIFWKESINDLINIISKRWKILCFIVNFPGASRDAKSIKISTNALFV